MVLTVLTDESCDVPVDGHRSYSCAFCKGLALVPRPSGWIKIALDIMARQGYLWVEPVYSDRGHEAESNPTAGTWRDGVPETDGIES